MEPQEPFHRLDRRGFITDGNRHLDEISEYDIVNLNIPTGMPLVYELDDHLRPMRHEYLGDPMQVQKAIEAVARQGKGAKLEAPA